jgi:hypothetical protein
MAFSSHNWAIISMLEAGQAQGDKVPETAYLVLDGSYQENYRYINKLSYIKTLTAAVPIQ